MCSETHTYTHKGAVVSTHGSVLALALGSMDSESNRQPSDEEASYLTDKTRLPPSVQV